MDGEDITGAWCTQPRSDVHCASQCRTTIIQVIVPLTTGLTEPSLSGPYMRKKTLTPQIVGITQAIGYLAGYAGDKKEDDKLYGVICWSVMRWKNSSNPDEVVGQVFDGDCITEADTFGGEDNVGRFIGYFTDDDEGRDNFEKAADAWREAGGEEFEDDDEEEGEEEEEDGDGEDFPEGWEDEDEEGLEDGEY